MLSAMAPVLSNDDGAISDASVMVHIYLSASIAILYLVRICFRGYPWSKSPAPAGVDQSADSGLDVMIDSRDGSLTAFFRSSNRRSVHRSGVASPFNGVHEAEKSKCVSTISECVVEVSLSMCGGVSKHDKGRRPAKLPRQRADGDGETRVLKPARQRLKQPTGDLGSDEGGRSDERSLFLGGLPRRWHSNDLVRLAERHGRVLHAQFFTISRIARRAPGRSPS